MAGAVREGEAVTDSIRGWAAINKGAPMTDAPIRTAREALEAAAQEAERIDEMLPTATGIHDAIRALAARIPAEPTSTAQRARELGAVVATNRDSAYTQVTSAWLDAARDFLREIAGETP